MTPQVKEFIEKYISDIKNNDFTRLYKQALAELFYTSWIGELTFILNKLGINPLEYMTYIPEGYYDTYPEESVPPIPSNIKEIMPQAFFDSNITNIRVPGSVKVLTHHAFDYAHELITVVIQEGLNCISYECFIDCVSLEAVYLPSSLIDIGRDSFKNCYNLKEIHYAGNIDSWKELTLRGINVADSTIVVHCSDGDITL